MARRGHGEGSIYQRADGRWTAVVDPGFENGKRKRKQVYGKTQREVREQLTAVLRDKDLGLAVRTDERQTVEQYLTGWLQTVEPTIAESTWVRYEIDVRRHLIPALGRIQLTRLSPQQVQQLYASKLAAGLSPTTTKHLHGLLHHALEDAGRLALVPRNVCDLVDPPRVAKHEIQVWTPEQVEAFLHVAAGHRLATLFVLAVTTGMREGELLALKWPDIDLNAGALQVRRNRAKMLRGRADKEPKTDSSRRRIRLTPTAVAALREHRTRQLEERLAAGEAWRDLGYVFTTSVGTALDPSNLLKQYRALIKRSGLPPIVFHDLRHSAASWPIAHGVPVNTVSQMLGHADPSITMRIYAHTMPDAQEHAAAVMERLLSRGK